MVHLHPTGCNQSQFGRHRRKLEQSSAIELLGHQSRKLNYWYDENGEDIRRLLES